MAMVQNCGRERTWRPHIGVREAQTEQEEQSPPFLADKDVYILIPRTPEYVTLRGKTDFTDGIKLKDSEMGRLSWLDGWAPTKCMSPQRGRTVQGCGQRTRQRTSLTVNMEEPGWLTPSLEVVRFRRRANLEAQEQGAEPA